MKNHKSVRLTGLSLSGLVILSLYLFSSTSVHARNSASGTVQNAQNLLIEGKKFLAKKKYRKALDRFEDAHKLVPDVTTSLFIGAIYIKLNRCVDAFKSWQEGLALCGTCAKQQELRDKLTRYTKQCASVVQIDSAPKAQVAIDNRFVGDTPYQGMLLRGRHQVQISAKGYQTFRTQHEIKPPTPFKLRIDLNPEGRLLGVQTRPRPEPIQPPVQKPSLQVMTPPVVVPSFQNDLQNTSPFGENDPNEDFKARNQTIRKGLWISSLVLSLGAGVLFFYTENEYNKLFGLSRTSRIANEEYYNRAQRAGNLQTTSRVMLIVSGTNLITSFFFLD